MKTWSIKAIQDLIIEREEWAKKTLYATDSEKCPSGVYYALKGEKPTSPDDPRGLRRMEVGAMIEYNQVKKLRSLGILVEAQRRIADDDYKVSGRHDGIVISPEQCTEEAKKMIQRKVEIFQALKEMESEYWKLIDGYHQGSIERQNLLDLQTEMNSKKQDLYDEEFEINKELLKPNPENLLILMEIKSISEIGFKWRANEGTPQEGHRKQIMFYLWKLRELYPYIQARIIYVDTTYQEILEFDVKFDEKDIEALKEFWSYINDCLEKNVPPVPAPNIIRDQKTGKLKVNYQAEWCKYHSLCTGDPDWLGKAIKEVGQGNLTKTKKK